MALSFKFAFEKALANQPAATFAAEPVSQPAEALKREDVPVAQVDEKRAAKPKKNKSKESRHLADKIDLTGFKDQIVAKISQRRFAINDTSKIPQNIRTVQRKWITDYLPVSRKGLLNFLLLRSPAELQVTMPETLNIQSNARPAVQKVWEPGVTASYQWLLDGKPIEGATKTTYKILDEQLGHKLKLRITLKKAAVKDTVFFSSSKKVLAKALTKTPIPTIEGKPVIGKTLKAITGTWNDQVTLKIQWLRNGNPIDGATKSNYKISKLDFDQHITVKVTGTKPGFATVTRTSEPTKKVS